MISVPTPTVSFYVLANNSLEDRFQFACLLANKALKSGHTVTLLGETRTDAHYIDQLLWSFRPDAFVPHVLDEQIQSLQVPVSCFVTTKDFLDWDQLDHLRVNQAKQQRLLINLSSGFEQKYAQFNRIAEIVIQDVLIKQHTRHNYRRYQQIGCDPITHGVS